LYKKDTRFGPGSLKYPNNKEDVGFWIGDKLIRLIVSINVNFAFKDLDEIDKKFELKSWYDREILLEETLNPQNMFLNKLSKVKDNAFIRNDPYIEKLLEKNIAFYDKYLNSFQALRDSFSLPGIVETCSIELLNACNQENLDKVKELKNHVNIDVCDNRGYNSFIISVVCYYYIFYYKSFNFKTLTIIS